MDTSNQIAFDSTYVTYTVYLREEAPIVFDNGYVMSQYPGWVEFRRESEGEDGLLTIRRRLYPAEVITSIDVLEMRAHPNPQPLPEIQLELKGET